LDVAVDSNNNVYIADTNNANIRMITASTGNISTFAGATAVVSNVVTVKFGFSGDGGVATSAGLAGPAGVAVDSSGNVYIATYMDNRSFPHRAALPRIPRATSTWPIAGTIASEKFRAALSPPSPATVSRISAAIRGSPLLRR
jgi:hypothetical protein